MAETNPGTGKQEKEISVTPDSTTETGFRATVDGVEAKHIAITTDPMIANAF